MIRAYCDGCNEEIPSGENRVDQRIKGDLIIGKNTVRIELLLGTSVEDGNVRTVAMNQGQLCKVCAVRAVLFVANGFSQGRLDPYCAEKPDMRPLPRYVKVREHGED